MLQENVECIRTIQLGHGCKVKLNVCNEPRKITISCKQNGNCKRQSATAKAHSTIKSGKAEVEFLRRQIIQQISKNPKLKSVCCKKMWNALEKYK